MWPLSCYAPKGDEPNLLGGDSSVEEVRWVTYNTARLGQDPRQVHAKVDEFANGKQNDIRSILNFPNNQLKQVLEMAAVGTMAPAGLTRVIDCTFMGMAPAASPVASPGGFVAGHTPSPNAFAQTSASPFGGSPVANVQSPSNAFGPGAVNGQAAPPFGNQAATPFGVVSPVAGGGFGGGTPFVGGGGSGFGGVGGGGTQFGGGASSSTNFGGASSSTGFGGDPSGPVTQQSDVFGVAVAGDNNDNPWTAACFVPGAVPDTPPPREMA